VVLQIVFQYAEGFDWRDETVPWPIYLIDSLFWADAVYTSLLVVLAGKWRWLSALVAVPALAVTAVLTITGGMWIDCSYF
jgi:hypothetical protein